MSACLPACLSERRGAGELTVSSEQWEYLGFPNVTNDTWADYDLQYINPSAVRWHSRTHTVVRTSLCVPGDVVCVDVWRRMCVALCVPSVRCCVCPMVWQDWRPSVIADWVETIKAIKKRNPTAVVVGTFHTTEVPSLQQHSHNLKSQFLL